MDGLRRSSVTLPIIGNLAVAAGVAALVMQDRRRLTSAQLFTKSTGTGAGNTVVQVKKGAANLLVADLTIAGAAGTKYTTQNAKGGGVPEGFELAPGDVLTIDVTSAPATTAAADGYVVLHFAQVDL